MIKCTFCGHHEHEVRHGGVFHKVNEEFGPFDIAVCNRCKSAFTVNPPSPEQLEDFYLHYNDHRPDWYLNAQKGDQLAQQYEFYGKYIAKSANAYGRIGDWVDIGTGWGEVAALVAKLDESREGVGVDIPTRPEAYPETVEYKQVDLNKSGWHRVIGRQFDTVFSIAVWEHVLDPALLATESLSLVRPGGRLIFMCPAWDTAARKVFNRKWPYFNPGEHLSVPSLKGAEICLNRAAEYISCNAEIRVEHINVGYNLRYVANTLGIGKIEKIVPNISLPVPTGMLAAVARVHSYAVQE